MKNNYFFRSWVGLVLAKVYIRLAIMLGPGLPLGQD